MAKTSCLDRLHEVLGGDKTHYTNDRSGKESGKSFQVQPLAAGEVVRIKVGEGILPRGHAHSQCDYVVVGCHQDTRDFRFIELKGDGIPVEDAITQLEATIRIFRGQHYLDQYRNLNPDKANLLHGHRASAHVVGGKMPRQTPDFRTMQATFYKTYRMDLKKEDNPYKISLFTP